MRHGLGGARRLLKAALVGAALLPALPALPQQLMDLPEARRLAVAAGLSGNAGVAEPLAAELLRLDPRDADALLAMAAVGLAKGAWPEAGRLGRRAFRLSGDPEARFHAARVAATAAAAQKRLLPAQFWLRRAGDLAPTEADRAKIARNWRALQAETPWRYRFDMSAMPSSNVNGGAESAYNVIEGVPLVGFLSPDAQALSGFVTQANLRLSYRLDRSPGVETLLTSALYLKRVTLSDEARAKAPGYDAGRLDATSVEAGLSHSRAAGTPGAFWRLETGVRDYWQGGERSYIALLGSGLYSRPLGERLRFTGSLALERRFHDTGMALAGQVRAGLSYGFADGGRLSAVLGYAETRQPNPVFDSHAVSGRLSYALGKPVLSVDLAAGIGASVTDYANYSLGIFAVPGGRRDEAVFFDIDATFRQIEYAGFSPSLRLRRAVTRSNVSRFDTAEWAVSLGISSNF